MTSKARKETRQNGNRRLTGEAFEEAMLPLQTRFISYKRTEDTPIDSGSDIAVLFKESQLDTNSSEVKTWYDRLKKSWDKFWKSVSGYNDRHSGLDLQAYSILQEIDINKNIWPSPTYNLSFQFQTQGGSYTGTSLGPFSGVRNGKIPVNEWIVILPKTRAEEFFTISVRLMATSWLKARLTQVTQILQFAQKYAPQVPGSGAVISQTVGIVGDIINLAAALDSDKALINDMKSYMLKDVGVKGVPRLSTGLIKIVEINNPKTYITLQILKL